MMLSDWKGISELIGHGMNQRMPSTRGGENPVKVEMLLDQYNHFSSHRFLTPAIKSAQLLLVVNNHSLN